MQAAESITAHRLDIWGRYHAAFEVLEQAGRVRRLVIPVDCAHNAHMYYLLLHDLKDRTTFIEAMKQQEINCVFHYVPLHTSPQGIVSGRAVGDLPNTCNLADRLVRLPLWLELGDGQDRVIDSALNYLSKS